MGVQTGLNEIRTGYISFANRGTIGHWDISNGKKRLFCSRGEPGEYGMRDETGFELVPKGLFFQTPEMAMAFICDLLGYGVD